jgi:hypothetical protein
MCFFPDMWEQDGDIHNKPGKETNWLDEIALA